MARAPFWLAGAVLVSATLLAAGPVRAGGEEPLVPTEFHEPVEHFRPVPAGVICTTPGWRYSYSARSKRWSVARKPRTEEDLRKPINHLGRYTLWGVTVDDRRGRSGVLEVWQVAGRDSSLVDSLTLWSGAQFREKGWVSGDQDSDTTWEGLPSELYVSEPEIEAVVEDSASYWIGIGFYSGEGSMGIGSVVRLSKRTGKVTSLHPLEIESSSISAMAVVGRSLWMGTSFHGEYGESQDKGLVRLELDSGKLDTCLSQNRQLLDGLVTALGADGAALWVGTESGVTRLDLRSGSGDSWRIAPVVRLAAAIPVSNMPGRASKRESARGTYEVLRLVQDSLLVTTSDFVEGWARRPGDLNQVGSERHPLALTGTLWSDPAATAHRIGYGLWDAHQVGRPDNKGWIRVRAHSGWIERRSLELVPRVVPAGHRR